LKTHQRIRAKLALTSLFDNARLAPHTRIIVRFVKPAFIGKVYTFRIRAAQRPSNSVNCLAPW
jgi:hypothetical protein